MVQTGLKRRANAFDFAASGSSYQGRNTGVHAMKMPHLVGAYPDSHARPQYRTSLSGGVAPYLDTAYYAYSTPYTPYVSCVALQSSTNVYHPTPVPIRTTAGSRRRSSGAVVPNTPTPVQTHGTLRPTPVLMRSTLDTLRQYYLARNQYQSRISPA
eukprot:924737-Rhodomonas_salina.6